MFRSLFPQILEHAPGRAVAWTSGLIAVAAIGLLTLGTPSHPAAAQAPGKPLRMDLTKLVCLKVSNDNTWPNADRDEPYVLIFTAYLTPGSVTAQLVTTPVIENVVTGTTKNMRLKFWPPNEYNGTPVYSRPIGSDDEYICLAAVLESDHNLNHGYIVDQMEDSLQIKLFRYHFTYRLPRHEMVRRLRLDMEADLERLRRTYGDADDRVGGIFEILWGPNGLQSARGGYPVELLPQFVGSDSRYQLTFRVE